MEKTTLKLPDGRTVTLRVRGAEAYLPNLQNTNQGTERGKAAIDDSLRQSGFHRSIVVSADDTVINGNHAYAAASELGVVASWVEIEVEGDVGVVTKRIDWESAQDPKAIVAALADNRTSELNFVIDPQALAEAIEVLRVEEVEVARTIYTPEEFGELIEAIGVSEPVAEEEQGRANSKEVDCVCPNCGHEFIRQI